MAQYTQGEMHVSDRDSCTLCAPDDRDGDPVIVAVMSGRNERALNMALEGVHSFPSKESAKANAARLALCWNMHDRAVGLLRATINMIDGDGAPPNWDMIRTLLASIDGAK